MLSLSTTEHHAIMPHSARHILICFALLTFATTISAQTGATEKSLTIDTQTTYTLNASTLNAFATTNEKLLAQSFNQSIEIATPEGSGIYSSKQAEMVMGEFFSAISAAQCSVEHETQTGNATLTIASLTAGDRRYRIYILTQGQDESQVIHQIRIEEQNE